MPCYDPPYDPSGDVSDLKREVKQLTELLCELAQIVGSMNGVPISPELRQWIAQHRAHDERQGRRWR